MDEKILIKMKSGNNKAIYNGICLAFLIIGLAVAVYNSLNYSLFDGFNKYFWTSILPYNMAICFLPCAGVAILIYLWIALSEFTVTNVRVYGKTSFGKRVDLPIDSISAVGTSWFQGLSVSTSSGRITFLGVSNRDDIYKVISKLLAMRQNKTHHVTTVQASSSNADELKKYKELLDSGIITQEEFDAKKKQLLGL